MKQIIVIGLIALLCNQAEAKNVILFVGDGMGISTVTAARIHAGQKQGQPGEEHQLSFDKFDHVSLVKTYNTDAQVPDSAGTITAMLAGHKTNMGVLGVSADAKFGDCETALNSEIPSLLELAEVYGKASGVVSTARITHATPAGTYSHSANRNWESAVPEAAALAGCRDIARQLIEFEHGDGPEVVLGGGRAQFLPTTVQDQEYPDKSGQRADARNLLEEWRSKNEDRRFVWNTNQFDALDASKDQQVLGLFEPSHMQFEADRDETSAGEPSLAAMTEFAIQRLSQSEEGYFLLVEAGRIDHAHHFGNAYRALEDTLALDAAVAKAVELVDLEDTLIVVTADHSHTLTISGYPARGNPILGKVNKGSQLIPDQKVPPYTTLGYANGPGYKAEYPDLSEIDTTAKDYQQIAAVPMPVETHAGEDVAAFAQGLGASGIKGVMEQNRLFYVMHEALFGNGE